MQEAESGTQEVGNGWSGDGSTGRLQTGARLAARVFPCSTPSFHPAAASGGGKAAVGRLTPGTTVWVLVRTIGLKGVMGDWSALGKLMVV